MLYVPVIFKYNVQLWFKVSLLKEKPINYTGGKSQWPHRLIASKEAKQSLCLHIWSPVNKSEVLV